MNWHYFEQYLKTWPCFNKTFKFRSPLIIAKEGDANYKREFLLAIFDELFREKLKELTEQIYKSKEYPALSKKEIKILVKDSLIKKGYPKPWRIKKRATQKRKEIKLERGY